MTLTEFIFLGWRSVTPPDTCWLDCPEPGTLEREHAGQHIILCQPHAELLEKRSFQGDYTGAPVPAGSIATDWPWLPSDVAA